MRAVVCPGNDFLCPYFENGDCLMEAMEGVSPFGECDYFDGYEDDEEEGGE